MPTAMNKIYKLSELTDIQQGLQTWSPDLERSSTEKNFIIQGKDFDKELNLKHDSRTKIDSNSIRNREFSVIKEQDILFLAKGNDHFIYFVSQPLKNTFISASLMIIRVKSQEILPEYLSWWLNQKEAKSYINVNAGTSGISFVTIRAMSNLPVVVPLLDIQNKIINICKLMNHEEQIIGKINNLRKKIVQSVCIKSVGGKIE